MSLYHLYDGNLYIGRIGGNIKPTKYEEHAIGFNVWAEAERFRTSQNFRGFEIYRGGYCMPKVLDKRNDVNKVYLLRVNGKKRYVDSTGRIVTKDRARRFDTGTEAVAWWQEFHRDLHYLEVVAVDRRDNEFNHFGNLGDDVTEVSEKIDRDSLPDIPDCVSVEEALWWADTAERFEVLLENNDRRMKKLQSLMESVQAVESDSYHDIELRGQLQLEEYDDEELRQQYSRLIAFRTARRKIKDAIEMENCLQRCASGELSREAFLNVVDTLKPGSRNYVKRAKAYDWTAVLAVNSHSIPDVIREHSAWFLVRTHNFGTHVLTENARFAPISNAWQGKLFNSDEEEKEYILSKKNLHNEKLYRIPQFDIDRLIKLRKDSEELCRTVMRYNYVLYRREIRTLFGKLS